MNIIFGDAVKELPDSYTVLELDTIRLQPVDKVFTSYCAVEQIPIAEFALLDTNKKIHSELMEQYRKRNWNYCQQAILNLKGLWNREVDSFYDDIQTRVAEFQINPPPEEWDGILVRKI